MFDSTYQNYDLGTATLRLIETDVQIGETVLVWCKSLKCQYAVIALSREDTSRCYVG